MRSLIGLGSLSALILGCNVSDDAVAQGNGSAKLAQPFNVTTIATFNEPWAMTFLPDGSFLVTEKAGRLRLEPASSAQGSRGSNYVQGVPAVAYQGQGGLGDVVLHPDFRTNRMVYLSWAEAGASGTRGAAVGRGKLVVDSGRARLEDFTTIWRQHPKVTGAGHYGHRIAFSSDGHLYISSGDRQKFDPAQDMTANLGKIIRLRDDGAILPDNPWASRGGIAAQLWVTGLRNPLGIAFDGQGRLWEVEMGPKGGDELNLIERGRNYGYPIVSNGDHYDGRNIPDHSTRPEFEAPKISWTPVISPGNLIIYSGALFPEWQGHGFVAGLSSEALVHVAFDGAGAREVERWDMDKRIREVEQGPDGAIYLLEDGDEGRLLKLSPAG